MATSVRLTEKLATLFNARVSTCSNTYKHLQAADLVSRGGRGRHAAQVTAKDSVMLLFALIGSEHINDGPEAARRYSSLVAKWRGCSGAYSDERSDSEARWYAMENSFPYLKPLDVGHTLSEAVVALVNSYKDGAVPAPQPTIAVTIRGPQISATIRFDDQGGMEQIDYGPASGRDMFRTIIGNPNNTNTSRTANYLHVEKRITAETLQALGELLRDDGV
jgi:hypothetical protein